MAGSHRSRTRLLQLLVAFAAGAMAILFLVALTINHEPDGNDTPTAYPPVLHVRSVLTQLTAPTMKQSAESLSAVQTQLSAAEQNSERLQRQLSAMKHSAESLSAVQTQLSAAEQKSERLQSQLSAATAPKPQPLQSKLQGNSRPSVCAGPALPLGSVPLWLCISMNKSDTSTLEGQLHRLGLGAGHWQRVPAVTPADPKSVIILGRTNNKLLSTVVSHLRALRLRTMRKWRLQ